VAIVEAIGAGDANLAAQRTIQHVRELSKEMVIYLGIPADLLSDKEHKLLEVPLPALT
jgi:hypothetical protein